MYKKLFLLAVASISVATNAQESNSKRGFYLKAGASYFTQTVATEFPTVSGNAATNETYIVTAIPTGPGTFNVTSSTTSKESITGSFGEGFRTNLVSGFRFNERLGIEMGIHYYTSNSKTMVERHALVKTPISTIGNFDVTANGVIRALDLSPSLVLFLGEKGRFEPYTKVGVIVPILGDLTIKTSSVSSIPASITSIPQFSKYKNSERTDVIKPNPTIGFMSAIGTTFKLTNKLSAYAEIEYRNFTVHGKTKETTSYTVEGADALASLSYYETHTNYVSQLNTSSNNSETNPTGYDSKNAKDELSSYVGISGIGLTLGIKYSL